MNNTQISVPKTRNKWYVIDAKAKNLGRLSSQAASLLRGKNHIDYSPSANPETHIIIINTQYIEVTGRKKYQKTYYRHSGRPGSLKTETFDELQNRIPNRIIEQAIRKMLPKGPLGRKLFRNLKVYANNAHPHQAQNPVKIQI
uniref:Ribosomal protein L13 n=1 Tax=Palmaria palmata TaxID=2822 RepID=A0A1C9CHE7_PALPL|nr:ribosomal protein L13 [Palmaria palmata]AOM67814.1 ribosomal protein L13 [Palmaria palmata]